MKKLQAGIGALLGGILVLSVGAREVSPTRQEPAAVVGTFDSRGVLMAYVRSDEFMRELKKTIQKQARKWGVTVSSIKFQDLTKASAHRVFGGLA